MKSKYDYLRTRVAAVIAHRAFSFDISELSHPGWTSILKLSTLWDLEELRKRSIAELTSLKTNPIDKIVLARAYKVSEWVTSSYTELVFRDTAITDNEVATLGYEAACRLFQLRETTRTGGYVFKDEEAVTEAVRLKFESELKDAAYA